MQSSLEDIILTNPEVATALSVVILALLAAQRLLPYRSYKPLHDAKTLAARLLHPAAKRRGRPLIRRKGLPDDSPAFVTHDGRTPRQVYTRLRRAGFSGHLVATSKYRVLGDGTWQFSHAQLVFVHDDGMQTEVFLFDGIDGGTDVYAHLETVTADPVGHLSDEIHAGDPRGIVTDALTD